MTASHNADTNHDSPHIVSWKTYVFIWVILMILSAITVGASYINFGSWNMTIALAIATVKGTFVVLIFMHLLYDEKFNLVVFVASVLMVLLFFIPTLLDMRSTGLVDSQVGSEINTHIFKPKNCATYPKDISKLFDQSRSTEHH